MTMKTRETARRNLQQRIERLLEGAEPLITGWQAAMVLLAIEQLRTGNFDMGERTVMKAERPDLWQWSTPIEGPIPRKRTDLIKSLAEALKTD